MRAPVDLHGKVANQDRANAAQRGYNRRWQKYRKAWLRHHPACAMCGRMDIKGMHVDHIQPHGGNMDLFWAESNHQTLCHGCHNRKTARERESR